MGFKRMEKMDTTEPSVDEVGNGMKKGGKTKKMAMGGAMPVAPLAAAAAPMGRRAMPARRPDPRAAMMNAAMAQRAPMMRKKGGEVESKAMHAKEEREIKGLKSELKAHEGKPASKAHKGLKMGGLLGGIEATRPNPKRMTGGIEGPGYKSGGKIQRNTVAQEAKTKMVTAKQVKSLNTKTGGLEGRGYAKGGSVKKYENTLMHGGPKMPTKPLGTKSIKQEPAGYKDGGHCAMKTGGESGFKGMKKGGCW
jgi:hypothetical protein